MIKTIVRAYSLEIPDEDIVRMRNWWRQRTVVELHGIDTIIPCELNDNGTKTFAEWVFDLYETASEYVDGGDHSGALYWAPSVGGWVNNDYLEQKDTGEVDPADLPIENCYVFDFGPVTYIFHGYDGDVEADGEDKFYEGAEFGVPTIEAQNVKEVRDILHAEHKSQGPQGVVIGNYATQNNTFS